MKRKILIGMMVLLLTGCTKPVIEQVENDKWNLCVEVFTYSELEDNFITVSINNAKGMSCVGNGAAEKKDREPKKTVTVNNEFLLFVNKIQRDNLISIDMGDLVVTVWYWEKENNEYGHK